MLIHGKLPAYITWDQYLANVRRLEDNCSQWDTTGVVREGESFLAGIIFCGRCGRRMFPHYKGKRAPAAYVCPGDYLSGGFSKCQRIVSRAVDDLVTQQVLIAIEPASLQLSLQATGALQKERDQVHAHWKRQLESAAAEARRLRRQFDAVEPANRLVAIELERCWEEALCIERRLKDDYDRFLSDQPDALTPTDILAVRDLATNVPRLWKETLAFSAEHKQIVRYLVERVILDIKDKTEVATVTIRWQGGFETQHGLVRSVAQYNRLADFARLKDRIKKLWHSGRSTKAIAETLNAEGFHTPTAGKKFTRHTVRKLLDSWGLTELKRPQPSAERSMLGSNERWLLDLSSKLFIDRSTLARWCRRGWVNARQLPGQRRWWIIWADEDECNRLRQLYEYGRAWPRRSGSSYPAELKTPGQKSPSD